MLVAGALNRFANLLPAERHVQSAGWCPESLSGRMGSDTARP
jgi:hypothetical protein